MPRSLRWASSRRGLSDPRLGLVFRAGGAGDTLALSCIPLEVLVDIRTDSAAACRVIRAFPDLSERQQLRSPQRPFLRFIHAVRQLKAARGAHYTLTHVKAHTGREDLQCLCGSRGGPSSCVTSSQGLAPEWQQCDLPWLPLFRL